MVTDVRGLPLKVEVTARQTHVSICVESGMDQIAIPRKENEKLRHGG